MPRIYQEKEESEGQGDPRERPRLLLGEYDGRWWYDFRRRRFRKTRRRHDRRRPTPTFEDYLATVNP